MRPLYHPAIEDVTVEAILHALSDPVRGAIFAELANSACTHSCSSFLQVSNRKIPKSTLSQHLKLLREAGLVRSERHGVGIQNTSRCVEINKKFPGLIPAIVSAQAAQSKTLQPKAGSRPAKKMAPRKTTAAVTRKRNTSSN